MADRLKVGVNKMLKRLICVCATLSVALLTAGEASAQHDVFGYPSGGCPGGCASGHAAQPASFGYGSNLKSRLQATQAQNEKIYARNAAWPKPFACASRQLYHNLWQPMYAAGWENQNILTSTHFNEEGKLTPYGMQQISSMLTSMPQSQRVIFVQKTADTDRTQMRLATVQNVIQTRYPHLPSQVRASDRNPGTLPGWRAVDITEKSTANAPSPHIPIATGSGGINAAVTQ